MTILTATVAEAIVALIYVAVAIIMWVVVGVIAYITYKDWEKEKSTQEEWKKASHE